MSSCLWLRLSYLSAGDLRAREREIKNERKERQTQKNLQKISEAESACQVCHGICWCQRARSLLFPAMRTGCEYDRAQEQLIAHSFLRRISPIRVLFATAIQGCVYLIRVSVWRVCMACFGVAYMTWLSRMTDKGSR